MSVTKSIASATAATELRAAGPARGVSIRNTDANRLYVLIGDGVVSSTNHTVAMETGDYFETPSFYAGEVITGIWTGDGSGAALVTEF